MLTRQENRMCSGVCGGCRGQIVKTFEFRSLSWWEGRATEGFEGRKWLYQLCLLGRSLCVEAGEEWMSCLPDMGSSKVCNHSTTPATQSKIFMYEESLEWREGYQLDYCSNRRGMSTSFPGVQESADQDFHCGFTSFYSMALGRLQDLLCCLGFQICKMGIKIPTLPGCSENLSK